MHAESNSEVASSERNIVVRDELAQSGCTLGQDLLRLRARLLRVQLAESCQLVVEIQKRGPDHLHWHCKPEPPWVLDPQLADDPQIGLITLFAGGQNKFILQEFEGGLSVSLLRDMLVGVSQLLRDGSRRIASGCNAGTRPALSFWRRFGRFGWRCRHVFKILRDEFASAGRVDGRA